MKISQLKVKNVLPLKFEKLPKETTVSKAIGIMKNKDIYSIAVYENNDFLGLITERNLVERNVPSHTKLKTLLFKPPRINPEDSFIEGVKKVLNSGYDAAPVFEENELVSVLSEYDIINIASKSDELNKEIAGKYSIPPRTIKMNEDIGKARRIMREGKVSRLPVVNKEGKLVGILNLRDIIKAIQPRESIGERDVSGEKIPSYEVPVSSIMNDTPLKISKDTDLKSVAEQMTKKKIYSSIIEKNGKPKGIITSKDIIEVISSFEKKEGVYLQIAGMPKIDEFKKNKMHKIIDSSVQKIGRIYENLQYLIVHIKEHKKGGKRTKYSIRTRFMTPVGLFVSKSWDWNLLTALDDALENLERQVIEAHKKHKDRKIPRNP